MAFRSAGSIAHLFKKFKGATRGGGAAQKPHLKVELDVSASHPKDNIRLSVHPDNQDMAKQLMTTAHPESLTPSYLDRLSHLNLFAATGELALKTGRALFRAKEEGLKEVVKGDSCSFKKGHRRQLGALAMDSRNNTAAIQYLTQLVEILFKHLGCPLPLPRPLPPSKDGNGGKSDSEKGDRNGKGLKKCEKSNGKNGGNSNGNNGGQPDGNGREGAANRGKADGNGRDGADGDQPEPLEDYFGGF